MNNKLLYFEIGDVIEANFAKWSGLVGNSRVINGPACCTVRPTPSKYKSVRWLGVYVIYNDNYYLLRLSEVIRFISTHSTTLTVDQKNELLSNQRSINKILEI